MNRRELLQSTIAAPLVPAGLKQTVAVEGNPRLLIFDWELGADVTFDKEMTDKFIREALDRAGLHDTQFAHTRGLRSVTVIA